MQFMTFARMRETGLRADYHMHSVYSDGKGTLAENAEQAAESGLAEIGYSDHVWQSSDWIPEYVAKIHELNDRMGAISLKAGGEAKAIDLDGNVDITPENAKLLDYVTGAVHAKLPMEPDPAFRDIRHVEPAKAAEMERDAAIAMCRNPMVDAIAHPMRSYYKFHYGKTSDELFPTSYIEAFLDAAIATGTVVEVYPGDPQLPHTLALYAEFGVDCIPASDAHAASRVGRIPFEEIFDHLYAGNATRSSGRSK